MMAPADTPVTCCALPQMPEDSLTTNGCPAIPPPAAHSCLAAQETDVSSAFPVDDRLASPGTECGAVSQTPCVSSTMKGAIVVPVVVVPLTVVLVGIS